MPVNTIVPNAQAELSSAASAASLGVTIRASTKPAKTPPKPTATNGQMPRRGAPS